MRLWQPIFLISLAVGSAQAQTCTFNPNGDFLSNFLNSCYAISFMPTVSVYVAGDADAQYSAIWVKNDPKYELVFYGEYPKSRFMSLSAYDDHQVGQGLQDASIVPLNSLYVNPFTTGVQYKSGQMFGGIISMGGGTSAVTPGCQLTGYNIAQNALSSAKRHAGMSWNGDPRIPADWPAHDDAGSSKVSQILLRRYLDQSPAGWALPVVMVRDLTTGCAIPASQAQSLGLVSYNYKAYWAALNQTQISYHNQYESNILPHVCYGGDPASQLQWVNSAQYLPGANPDARYVSAAIGADVVQNLITTGSFMRIRFRVPTVPNIPCQSGASCSLTGNEQVRYWGISFQNASATLGTISDQDVKLDANGYGTVIVGFGAARPAQVTARNGYTWFDLSKNSDFASLNRLFLRNIIPGSSFGCSTYNVPFRTTEYNPGGGFMGEYAPAIDFLTAAQIPQVAQPYIAANSCGYTPTTFPACQ